MALLITSLCAMVTAQNITGTGNNGMYTVATDTGITLAITARVLSIPTHTTIRRHGLITAIRYMANMAQL
jgi:hypothetical protein